MEPIVEEALSLAAAAGFDKSAPLRSDALVFREEVRAMCRADRCRSYNKTWTCPPGCGTLEEMRRKVSAFTDGILVETIGKMEDEFDYEAIEAAAAVHKKHFQALVATLRKKGYVVFPMGAGRCTICKECTYPDAPCRAPELAMPSMEAAGLLVSDVCERCNIPYYNGKNTTTFIACVLIGAPDAPPLSKDA